MSADLAKEHHTERCPVCGAEFSDPQVEVLMVRLRSHVRGHSPGPSGPKGRRRKDGDGFWLGDLAEGVGDFIGSLFD